MRLRCSLCLTVALLFVAVPGLCAAEEISLAGVEIKSEEGAEVPKARFKENVSLALLWRRQTNKEGGLLEFGYPIYKGKRHFFIRGAAAFEFCNGDKTSGHQFFT